MINFEFIEAIYDILDAIQSEYTIDYDATLYLLTQGSSTLSPLNIYAVTGGMYATKDELEQHSPGSGNSIYNMSSFSASDLRYLTDPIGFNNLAASNTGWAIAESAYSDSHFSVWWVRVII